MNFSDYLIKRLSALSVDAAEKSGKQTSDASEALYNVSIFQSASSSDVQSVDYASLLRAEDLAAVNEGVDAQQTRSLNNVLSEFLNLEQVQGAADLDGDGVVSEAEAQQYLQTVIGRDGDASSLTMADIDAAINELGLNLAEVAENSLNEVLAEGSDEVIAEIDKPEKEEKPEKTNAANSASGGGSVGGGGGVGGGSGVGGSSASSAASKTNAPTGLDAMSLEELEAEKSEREATLQEKQDAVNAVHDGTNPEVAEAKKEMEKAQEDYEKKLEKDDKVPEELKTKQKTNLSDINKNQKEIDENAVAINNQETKISSQENTVSSKESEVASLQNSLDSLPQPEGTEESKEKDAEIAAKKQSIESQIATAKSELEKEKQTLEDEKEELTKLQTKKTELESKKQELEAKQKEIETEINSKASDETKKALSAYNEAKTNVETVKSAQLSTATAELDSAKSAVQEITKKITEVKNKETAKENSVDKFDFNFTEALTDANKEELAQIKKIFEENKDKYEKVAEATGVPAELICAIHYREGSCNFSTYLHNGDPLGQTTTHVPAGLYFEDWTDAAIDAIKSQNPEIIKDGDFDSCMEYAERYNGLGYRNKGLASPYVWAGTTKYTGGMYVADGQFSASAYDKRIGVAVAMKYLMQ